MKTATTPVRSVAAIDQELQGLNSKISPAEQALEQAKKTAAALEDKRRGVLVAARIDGDAKAVKQLEAFTPKLDRAALEARDSEAVRDEIRVRIKRLTGERLVAQRHELQVARSSAATKQLKLSQELDPQLAALVSKCGEWLDLSMTQYQLSADLGEPISRTPRQQVAWIIHEAFRTIAPAQFEKPPLRGASFAMLAERFADPSPEQEEERKTA